MKKLEVYAVEIAQKRCHKCSHTFRNEEVETFDHDKGYEVEGFLVRQWLYVTCPNCKCQNTLFNMGIEGTLEDEKASFTRRIIEASSNPFFVPGTNTLH